MHLSSWTPVLVILILVQYYNMQDSHERVIAYASKTLHASQRWYCTTKHELLMVVTFVWQYQCYLLGLPFLVSMYHASLTRLLKFKELEGMLAHLLLSLSTYDMSITHCVSAKHMNVD